VQLNRLYLHNFRSYTDTIVDFTSDANTIVGPNATGKTSLIEAVYLLFSGRSFRTTQLTDLIQFNKKSFYLEAHFSKFGIDQKLKIVYGYDERCITLNSTFCPNWSSLFGVMSGVVMTPDDISLVKGTPNQRRHYLDFQLAQVDPVYLHHLVRYRKAMKQRNVLLKRRSIQSIASWEQAMATSAAYITRQRLSLVADIDHKLKAIFPYLSGLKEDLSLNYSSRGSEGLPSQGQQEALFQFYMETFEKQRPREMDLGSSLTGPHRDDLDIALNDKELRFGSEGQQRSAVLALRMAEWQRIREQLEFPPLLLADDVTVNLDSSRRAKLLQLMQNMGQVFVTTTEALNFGTQPKILSHV
jgi:DNA replication and repair protein RecF